MLIGTGWGRVKDVDINEDDSATIILDEKINFDQLKLFYSSTHCIRQCLYAEIFILQQMCHKYFYDNG
jgi:hypothetical protein